MTGDTKSDVPPPLTGEQMAELKAASVLPMSAHQSVVAHARLAYLESRPCPHVVTNGVSSYCGLAEAEVKRLEARVMELERERDEMRDAIRDQCNAECPKVWAPYKRHSPHCVAGDLDWPVPEPASVWEPR